MCHAASSTERVYILIEENHNVTVRSYKLVEAIVEFGERAYSGWGQVADNLQPQLRWQAHAQRDVLTDA